MPVDAGSVYSEVRIRLDKLKADITAVNGIIDGMATNSKVAADKSEDSWDKSFNATKLAGVAAFAAITVAMRASIKVAGDFEQSMANVQSVVQGTESQFTALEDAAKIAGETTRFKASQAADALYDLASGGFDATQSVDALNGVLMLAGATQSDLADAAATVVATVNQYGLAASDAARISNVFSAAIARSMANMEKLTSGMRQVGPVASALGMSLEETVGALDILYDAGFQGEQAGTALRAILGQLASEADPTTEKIMALGLSFDQINPAANSLAQILGNIASVGATAGDIMAAFGTRAGAQMLALLRKGQKGLEDYTKAITGTNSAWEMYILQNDTLNGSIDRLKSAVEAAQIEFSEELTPSLRAVFDVLTGLIIAINKLPGPLKLFLSIIVGGIPIILGGAKALTLFSAAMAAASGPVGWVVAGVAGVVAGLSALNSAVDAAKLEKATREFSGLAETLGLTVTQIAELTDQGFNPKTITDAGIAAKLTAEQLESLSGVIASGVQWGSKFTNVLDDLATSYGLNRSEVIQLILANKNLSATERASLESELAVEQARANRVKVSQQTAAAAIAQTEAKTQAEKDAAEEQKRIAAQVVQAQKDNDAAFEKANLDKSAQYKAINELLRLGAITEVEAAQMKIKANNSYIDTLVKLDKAYVNYDEAVTTVVAHTGELTQVVDDATASDEQAAAAKKQVADDTDAAKAAYAEYSAALAAIGKEDQDLLDLERQLAIDRINNSKAEQAEKDAALKAIGLYYDRLGEYQAEQKEAAADKTAITTAEEYEQKLFELSASAQELIAMERKRAIAAVYASNASAEATAAAIIAINTYYDALSNDEPESDALKKTKDLARDIKQVWDDMSSGVASIFSAMYENQINALDAQMKAELEAAGIVEETDEMAAQKELDDLRTSNDANLAAIQTRLDAARAAGDTEAAIALQTSLAEQQAIADTSEAAAEAAVKKAQIEADFQKKKAAIEYKAELWAWRINLAGALADTAAAVVKSLPNPWLTAASAASGALGVAAIAMNKPEAPALATGGIILPSSGGTLTRQAENGYAELSMNAGPSGEAMMAMFASKLAEKINVSGSGAKSLTVNLSIDRKLLSQTVVDDINEGRVRLNR